MVRINSVVFGAKKAMQSAGIRVRKTVPIVVLSVGSNPDAMVSMPKDWTVAIMLSDVARGRLIPFSPTMDFINDDAPSSVLARNKIHANATDRNVMPVATMRPIMLDSGVMDKHAHRARHP